MLLHLKIDKCIQSYKHNIVCIILSTVCIIFLAAKFTVLLPQCIKRCQTPLKFDTAHTRTLRIRDAPQTHDVSINLSKKRMILKMMESESDETKVKVVTRKWKWLQERVRGRWQIVSEMRYLWTSIGWAGKKLYFAVILTASVDPLPLPVSYL